MHISGHKSIFRIFPEKNKKKSHKTYMLRTDELNARLVKYQTKLKVRLEQ